MKRDPETERDELREILLRGDPARDEREPGPDEIVRMRAELLAAARPGRARRWRPVPALAAAAVVCVVLLFGWNSLRNGNDGRSTEAVTSQPGDVEAPAETPSGNGEGRVRQIHFSTPGGTRVVWSLDPDFQV